MTNKQESNVDFYTNLLTGKEARDVWGMDKRFSCEKIRQHPSILKHFVPLLKSLISAQDRVLDMDCGPGSFFSVVAPMCRELKGVDIVPVFIESANEYVKTSELINVSAHSYEELENHVGEGFDIILMIDVLHHVEDLDDFIATAEKMLKDNGKLLIFEPNRKNFLLFIMCFLDKNERQLLKMGNFSFYKKLLCKSFDVISCDYNAMLIGPSSRLFMAVAEMLEKSPRGILRIFLPKLVIVAQKRVLQQQIKQGGADVRNNKTVLGLRKQRL
jgi:2-polyprenyl-3-methyl-5-hydroxy-6-metoxy-1,4-benzoquinol methylase